MDLPVMFTEASSVMSSFEPIVRPLTFVGHGEDVDLVGEEFVDHHVWETIDQNSPNGGVVHQRFEPRPAFGSVSQPFHDIADR
jgi:hypothetical protein